jgi:pyruvate kinase
MRQTRIIATLGPASATDDRVLELVRAGVDIFRLNFSHGSHEQHAASMARVRRAAAAAGRHIAILQDLSGPKIRTGALEGGVPLQLRRGAALVIATGDAVGAGQLVYTTFAGLAATVQPGMRLLLDDGKLELRVMDTDGERIRTEVLVGGELGEHKGINAPDVALPASALTAKDEADLCFGISQGVDLVALSFVQRAEDVREARVLLARERASSVALIAKIERPQAVASIDEILEVSDGIMVARGDLGNEVPLESVPRIQKEITLKAQARGVPVIVATQVLESMRFAPRPTRAEVSDAANAVDDSVDGIMLSGETAVGEYPVEAVRILDAVIRDVEGLRAVARPPVETGVLDVPHNKSICEAAVTLAMSARADAIVAVTREGKTARVLSSLRPPVPVHAITRTEATARRLMLHRGLDPLATDRGPWPDPTGVDVEHHLLEQGVLRAGDVIVFVSVNADLSRPDANFLRIRRVGDRAR